jgi:hypothetical protein
MKFSLRRYLRKKPKPLKAAVSGRDVEVRPAIAQVHLDKDDEGNPILVATNSYVLAKMPIDQEDDDEIKPGIIPRAAMEAVQKLPMKMSDYGPGFEFEVHDGGDVSVGSDVIYKGKDYQFPNWRQTLTTYEEIEKPTDPMRIGFNVKLLKDLADALALDSFEVTIDLDKVTRRGDTAVYERPLTCRPLGVARQDGREGIQMPIRIDVQ